MSENGGSSGSGAVVRAGAKRTKKEEEGKEPKKRKIFLDREELSAIRRNLQVVNGREDVMRSFFQGFKRKFPYSSIIDVRTMEQVLNCLTGKESTVVVEMEKPPPCSVFNLPLNKTEA